ncbi:T9SS type A sorting domain-containing protein [Olleya sp. R77988]|uniref:T9SS type A sorting domain-containing protein n=1 Tax=Olleya sp. R77988 TaxID=3093875 RepID=UPI0037C6CC77
MKKITFYLIMLLSITAFSQIEIVENFDDLSNNALPTGWTSTDIDAATSFACGGSGYSISGGFTAAGSSTVTTTDLTGVSNGTDLTASFSLNLFEQFSQFPPASYSAPATGWGSIVLEYSTDNGTTWTNIMTIDDSNFTFIDNATCGMTASVNAGAIASGSDFQARFVVTATTINNFALWVIIDNVSFTQVATTVPNCDATLTSPLAGSNTAESDVTLTWNAATGLPTGYNLTVGTASGLSDVVNTTTTDPNYNLTSLSYDTDYFVNITPFNGIGNATGCTEEMFTTRTAPIAGASCSSPHVVSSFPYLVTDDTNLYEDNFDASPCSNSYMNGKDVFYEITPATDMSINIELTNVDNNGASIHVVEGCVDVATNCVAYIGTYSMTATRLLENVVLTAGTTYYVVLSNSGSTRTYNYNLFISQNSCINPTMDFTPVADCSNAQFTVDVDVTYLGDASSLTLTDDFANTYSNITATGIVSAGPYPSGSTVNFTLTNDQDGTCSFAGSSYFYCPPANDECMNSIALTVNTDGTCTNVLAASNAGATKSTTDPTSCTNNNTNDVWFSFVATSENMVVEYLNITAAIGTGGTVQATELLEGTCGALSSISCSNSNYITYGSLVIGNTYYIRNSTSLSGEYAQDYDICIRELETAPTNDECANATTLTASADSTCASAVAGSTIGATTSVENTCTSTTYTYGDVWYVFNPLADGVYEFSLERLSTSPSTYYSVFSGSCGALVEMSTSCTSNATSNYTLDSTETYYVQVRSAQNGTGIDFNLCVYQLPDPVVNSDCSGALTLTESPDLNGANAVTGDINVTDVVYYSPEGACSSSYESVWYEFTPTYTGTYNFELTRTSGTSYYTVYDSNDCTSDLGYLGGDINSCFESGTDSGPMVAGTTYLISIQSSGTAEFEFFAYPDPTLSVESNNFETFSYFPNPVVNKLTIKAKNTISKVSIHNIVGQKVKTLTPNELNTTVDMNQLDNGIYFVTVTINNTQQTFKIIKK